MDELNKEYKEIIIERMETNRKEIEMLHLQLSKAFGIPIGFIKTLKLQIGHSSLLILQEIYDMKKNKVKDGLGQNRCLESLKRFLFVLFNVYVVK